MVFTIIERKILNLLYAARRPLTTKQTSDKLGIAWLTAKNNLSNLHKKKYVRKNKDGNRIYWRLRDD